MNNPGKDTDFKISFCMKSDLGKIRQKNEDFMDEFVYKSGKVFLVCDGLGGHAGGEVASKLAVGTIKEFIKTNADVISDIPSLIREALTMANITILKKAKENSELLGMGTTCIILILYKRFAYFGNVGDSRLYLIREGKIKQISKDQSYVQSLIDKDIITAEEARDYPGRNIITQALGISNVITPQINPGGMAILENDKFFLCSDGLTGMLKDAEIFNTVENSDFPYACEKLIDLANSKGGIDNITVQIIRVEA
jgi:PPM family protein phosphatase